MENTYVTFLDDHSTQESLPSLCKKNFHAPSNIFRSNSILAYNSVLSELTSKGRNPPLVLNKPAIPKRLNQQKVQPSETNGIIHCVNIGNSPEAPKELSDPNDKSKVNSMKCKKIFKQTIAITDEAVKYENMKPLFRRLPDTTWPPVPPCTPQAAGSSPKEQNEGEVKSSSHPHPNTSSTGISYYPPWAKGNSPGPQKDLFVFPRIKPEIMRKPRNFQGGVAVLPPSPPQATIPKSTSINDDTYKTADLNMAKEREEIPVQNHDVNIIKAAVLPPSPPQVTIPESISEETLETADLNMAKEWEQVPVRDYDTSSNMSSFFGDNCLSAQSKDSVTADVRSEAKLDELPVKQAIMPVKQKKRNAPRIKSLPFINSLKPPKKPPRPTHVDLSRFHRNIIQITGSQEAQKPDAVLSTGTYETSMCLSEVVAYDDTVKQVSPEEEVIDLSQKEDSGYDDACGLSSSSIYEPDPDSGCCSPDAAIKIYENHWDDQQYRSDYADDVKYINSTETSKKKPKPKDGKIYKKQLDFRKKYKISGSENAFYSTTATEDYKGGKDMLSLKKGHNIEIIEIMDCPAGMWLAKNEEGNYGFISVSSVNVKQEHLIYLSQPLQQDSQYDDVGHLRECGTSLGASFTSDGYADMSVDTWDEISVKSAGKSTSAATDSYEFPNENEFYSTTITAIDKKGAKQKKKIKPSKQEREFREKFKYTKDIVVLKVAVVNKMAPRSAKSKSDLSVKPGEKLEVIDNADENKVICRNAAGKYGHVAVERLDFIYNVFS
ncbi:FYN-binding protein 1-like isoform X2 [Xenopus laevis]|nr:FYN-binding protein 1-like isoform X2 [Xenopus laevis]